MSSAFSETRVCRGLTKPPLGRYYFVSAFWNVREGKKTERVSERSGRDNRELKQRSF